MAEFRNVLRDRLLTLTRTWVGPTAGPVITFDDHLYSLPIEQLPFLVVNVRNYEKIIESNSLGARPDKSWEVHVYYLDMDPVWATGDTRRDNVIGILEQKFDRDFTLGKLEATLSSGEREYVYDTEITSATFDSSGQDGEYSFVTELYLKVYTSTT